MAHSAQLPVIRSAYVGVVSSITPSPDEADELAFPPSLPPSGVAIGEAPQLGFRFTDDQLTALELARDRGRGVSQTLGARSGAGRPKGPLGPEVD
jgi:hypothetical protein